MRYVFLIGMVLAWISSNFAHAQDVPIKKHHECLGPSWARVCFDVPEVSSPCADPKTAENGKKTAFLPTCEITYTHQGCDAAAPSGFFDTSTNSCYTQIDLALPKEFVACGVRASVTSFTRNAFFSNNGPHDNVWTVHAVAQNATRAAGGQWIWADVTVKGYRKDVSLSPGVLKSYCTVELSGAGQPWHLPGACSCLSVPGQQNGVLKCGGSTFGICTGSNY